MSSEAATFRQRAAKWAADEAHFATIARNIANYDVAVSRMTAGQFRDWQRAREAAAAIRNEALARLPELLDAFQDRLCARGATVLWAEDAAEARGHVERLIREHGVRKVVKGKSMTTEEIGLNEWLTELGVAVWESDLGELIVQLAGEKPYHILTPAMHKSRGDIARLFHRHLGTPEDADVDALAAAARHFLRDHFLGADMGITGANFLLADEGAVVVTENEGNARLSMSCPRLHVVIAGIEKVLPRMSDLSLLLPLLATSGTGQRISCYNSIVRGPRQPEESDGPDDMVVILLDNGRSAMHADRRFRAALRCIRCGACLNACPVYRTIGGHAYHTAYPGPIGAVITPHLKGLRQWQHLAHASSLCGACADVCPVCVPLDSLLLQTRWEAHRQGQDGWFWRWGLGAWQRTMHRSRLEAARRLWRWCAPVTRRLLPRGVRRRVPSLPARSFAEWWRSHE